MSFSFKEHLELLTRQLIENISELNVDSDAFKTLEKKTLVKLQNVDTFFRPNEKEINRIIQSLTDKFIFHGFPVQAKDLQRLYKKLTPVDDLEHGDSHKLSVVQLLISLSESPTNNFYKYPQNYYEQHDEEVIDWPKYLQEGITRWTPPPDVETSESDSDTIDGKIDPVDTESTDTLKNLKESVSETIVSSDSNLLTYHDSKLKLTSNVQSHWFNTDKFAFKPISDDPAANVAILWDDYVDDVTKGLVVPSSNIISEYKILRELIWQFYEPHCSSCFKFSGNRLIPRLNVTIASVRSKVCESFLYEFVPYIEWLQVLREFSESLITKYDKSEIVIPDTYRSYDFAVQTIIKPIFIILKDTENKIKSQETTVTLLSLANELRPLFQTVKLLQDIHQNVTLDFRLNSPTLCATTLLSRLYRGLFYASSKLEQDLYLTLYLHSLYKYCTIINSWLGRDILEDYSNEFVISDQNPKDPHVLYNYFVSQNKNQTACANISKIQQGEQDWQMEFSVKDLDEHAKADTIMNLICTHVLQIGKNIHLLRLLGKTQLFSKYTGSCKDNFYDVFIRKVLEKIASYFNVATENNLQEEAEDEPLSPTFIFPAVCPDECKYYTEMDKLENLVDTSDGFLMKAFESFFVKKPEKKPAEDEALFERIQNLTKSLFPIQNIIANVFIEILEERYSILGIMVKNVLVQDYELENHFVFLQNIFLFKDDMIFPVYRHLFNVLDSNGSWGNHAWLTSHFQDIIVDAYPNFYDKASIELKDDWHLSIDPLKACRMVNVQYRIEWPVNIIIRNEHIEKYRDLFQFILKIKWALYTLNHLCFTELEPKKSIKTVQKSLRKLIIKLKMLRFGLLNMFSTIQHYILGHIFSEFSLKFKKAFENAYGLESVIKAHTDFIYALHKACDDFQQYQHDSYGFFLLLYLVRKLRIMWRHVKDIKDEELDKCEKSYWMCHDKMNYIVNPTRLVYGV